MSDKETQDGSLFTVNITNGKVPKGTVWKSYFYVGSRLF